METYIEVFVWYSYSPLFLHPAYRYFSFIRVCVLLEQNVPNILVPRLLPFLKPLLFAALLHTPKHTHTVCA